MGEREVHPTILSPLHEAVAQDALVGDGMHLFSSSSEKHISSLRNLLNATSSVSRLVDIYSTMQVQNSKTVSMLRQHANNIQALHIIKRGVGEFISVPTKRPLGAYGEDVPLEAVAFGDWFVSRISRWGVEAKMEVFSEPESDGKRSIALGGKVLVLDIEIVVHPHILPPGVNVSFAVPSETNQTVERSSSLGRLLGGVLQAFVLEAKRCAAAEPEAVAKLGDRVQQGYKYLMELDRLAEKEGDAGVRWFQEVDNLGSILDNVCKMEINNVRQAEGRQAASLDIFLRRGHALPLPCLLSPALSFLIHVSPPTYLSLLRSASFETLDKSFALDVSIQHLRYHLSMQPQLPGVCMATLRLLSTTATLHAPPTPELSLSTRPVFVLAPEAAALDHTFPTPHARNGTDSGYAWCIDFTSGGQTPGVIMAQSRMREIESVINPLGELDQGGTGSTISYGNSSWLDMLINPLNQVSPERYSTVYTSPNNLHPPLDLRLGGLQEPGFLLELVPVSNMREVWAILEIIREQCWLNESVKLCAWSVNAPYAEAQDSTEDAKVTEDELNSVLYGTFTPRSIPVTVYIPAYSPPSSNTLFDSSLSARPRTSVLLTFPERPPITGLVEVAIVHDVTRSRGVSVEIRGAMGADIRIDDLEESVRRGGLFGIPGRIWSMTHSAT